MWANLSSSQAAQLALGDAGSMVTMLHYVNSTGLVARALDRLPQPAAFLRPQAGPEPRTATGELTKEV